MVLRLGIRLSLPASHPSKIVWQWCIQGVPAGCFSTCFIGDKPLLVRDFIRAALYDTKHGYFSKLSGPVGVLEKSIRFNQIEGRDAYLQYLDKIYKQHDVAWFTPVELFKPWYAHAIAEAILRTANLSVPLKIYEIGGGSGTCAKCILDYMLLNAPERVYNNMTYISVEISSSLAKRQLETVGEVSSHLNRYRIENRDALDRSGWHADPNPCWVIMLEVLDNLPHDLVYSPDQVSPWMEAWIEKARDSQADFFLQQGKFGQRHFQSLVKLGYQLAACNSLKFYIGLCQRCRLLLLILVTFRMLELWVIGLHLFLPRKTESQLII